MTINSVPITWDLTVINKNIEIFTQSPENCSCVIIIFINLARGREKRSSQGVDGDSPADQVQTTGPREQSCR